MENKITDVEEYNETRLLFGGGGHIDRILKNNTITSEWWGRGVDLVFLFDEIALSEVWWGDDDWYVRIKQK